MNENGTGTSVGVNGGCDNAATTDADKASTISINKVPPTNGTSTKYDHGRAASTSTNPGRGQGQEEHEGQGQLPSTSRVRAASCDEPPKKMSRKLEQLPMSIPGHPEEVKLLMQDFHLHYLPCEILKIVLDSDCLPKKDTLNCRHVSHQWNRTVLDHLQQHPSHLELNCWKRIGLRYYQGRVPWQGSLQRDWFTPENSLRIMEKLNVVVPQPEMSERNPFPSRKIFITDGQIPMTVVGTDGQRNINVWVNQVVSILHKYGRHVWHCSLEFSWEVMDPVIRYYCLRHWISRMPNLRSLKVVYRNHPTSLGWKEFKPHLVPRIKGKPMLELKHLTFLSVVNVPHPVFNEIVSKIPKDNLKKIRIQESANWLGSEDCRIIDVDKYDLALGSNISEASLKLRQHDYAKLESIESLWPLRKLHLHLDFGWSSRNNCPRAASWSRIFRFLGAKFSSLTHLGLILPGGCGKDKNGKTWLLRPSLKHRLNLPHLKELRIELINISTLEFLRPMKDSLEVLFLHFSCIDYSSVDPAEIRIAMAKQLIKLDPVKAFQGYGPGPYPETSPCSIEDFAANHPLKSNIWVEFPKLRRLTIQFSSCFWMEGNVRKHLGGGPEPFKRVYVRGSQNRILCLDLKET